MIAQQMKGLADRLPVAEEMNNFSPPCKRSETRDGQLPEETSA